ncbi:MAG: extracellular solute-binding protein [Spirochaetales bacterium]|nr:extracellular solute-binding protein [Spirochaetota bacterium]NLL24189.1 extracellular solute-binding protein [Spirochaetales bacterium]HPY44672.1 extracellular solute-binding protein [Sphaerochaeta sp.]HQB04511.1 extracellular solute-binding protein [Sphaerochaeta sp.]
MKNRFMRTILVLTAIMAIAVIPAFSGGKTESPSEPTSKVTVNKTGLPIVDEPITYELAANTRKNKNFKNLEYFQKLEAKTNVLIDWNMSPEDGWTEKKSLLFASNILPDAFYGQDILTDIDIIRYGSEGLLIPLNDLIDEYAPNLKAIFDAKPHYRQQITAPDGNIYSLPTINELNPTTHDHLFINKNWLKNLGLEIPNTTEEFEAVLQAFKDYDANGNGDPNDEIPFTFRMNANDPRNRQQGLQSLFGTFGQLDDIQHFIVDDSGKVIYTPTTEPYRDAIRWFSSLYQKGLIDKEVFTHNANVYVAKIQDPGDIVGMWLGWSRSATAAKNKENYVVMAPLINVNGERLWRTVEAKLLSKGSFAITNKAKNPEVLIRWIDQSYEGVTSLEICQGLIGRTLEEIADGRFQHMKLPQGMVLDTMIHDYSPGNDGTFALMEDTIKRLNLNANLVERRELDAFYKPYNVPSSNMYPNLFFTEDEIEKIAELQTDIESYVTQKYASWIVSGGVDREWDAFQKKLKDMRVDEYIKYYSDAYQRYLGE